MKVPYKVGQMLFLQQPPRGDEEPQVYKARIADISDQHIAVELPMSEKTGRIGIFMEKSQLEAWFFHADGAKYFFTTQLLGRVTERIPLLLFAHPAPNEIVKTQRRQFLRIPANCDLAVHPVEHGKAFEPFVLHTHDLSGGGFSFRLEKHPDLEEGTVIEWYLSLVMKDQEVLHPRGLGQVVRIFKEEENAIPFVYSIKLTEISEADIQKVIRYCFHRQLELNKKGLQV